MDKRFVLFLCIMFAALAGNAVLMAWLNPPRPPAPKGAQPPVADADGAGQPADTEPPDVGADAVGDDDAPPAEEPADDAAAPPAVAAAEQWIALGSLDPAGRYRMLVVLSSVGAAVDEIVLNDRFADLSRDQPQGYLGPLAADDAPGGGAAIRLVVAGTPAATAGLQPGDVIAALDGKPIDKAADLERQLAELPPGRTVELAVKRGGQTIGPVTVTLAERPLHVASRERNRLGLLDQPSLLLTLAQYDDQRLADADEQLEGVRLRDTAWELVASDETSAEFRYVLADQGLTVFKHYRLAADAPGETAPGRLNGYHLDLEVEIRNRQGGRPHQVAYRLDGATGLPTEGWWYGSKVGGSGTRDVAKWYFGSTKPELVSCTEIADEDFVEEPPKPTDTPLIWMGVDAQYFAAVLIPQKEKDDQQWHADSRPIRAGPVPEEKAERKLLNTSCRLTSLPQELKPGEGLRHSYRLFAGPKKPDLLAQYRLDGLVQYGWFGGVSRILLKALHFFHDHLVFNYGIAIVMLTVLVRGCMLPISLKQALGAQKMQELQPEIKRINERYKSNLEQKNKALQELFRKHKYNPLGGCLLVFLQLPIFIGLYRALMVDVELRQAPLVPGLSWCSNLAAPDMLFRWDWGFLPGFLVGETGYLGPYFNVLPLVTVGLYLWQQALFMPPATDEQTALQQKMLKYMTVFMGVLFFKVASGLCIYFIASSLWSIAERKLMPKFVKRGGGAAQAPAKLPARSPSGNGEAGGKREDRKKQRER